MDEFYKFKEGDLVWWFDGKDCLEYHPLDIPILSIESGIVKYHVGNGKIQVKGIDGVTWWELLYTSKRAALEALASRLKELMDND